MFDKMVADMMAQIIPMILLVGLISVLITVFKVFFVPKIKGKLGEYSANSALRRNLDQNIYHLLADVMLPTSDGTTQIDHIVVSRYGIFVIETKAYKGWIYGNERDPQWTQVNFKQKYKFQNPLRQNYKHVKTLSELTGLPMSYFKSLVVFVVDCTFKTDMPENVIRGQYLTRHIREQGIQIINDEQVPGIVSRISNLADSVTEEQRKDHVKNLRQRKTGPTTATATITTRTDAPACPRCASPMVLRTSRKDQSEFWGCPGYPKCRGVRNLA